MAFQVTVESDFGTFASSVIMVAISVSIKSSKVVLVSTRIASISVLICASRSSPPASEMGNPPAASAAAAGSAVPDSPRVTE